MEQHKWRLHNYMIKSIISSFMRMLPLNINIVYRWAAGMDEIIEALCKGTRCETDRLPTLSAANPSQEALQNREQKRPRRVRTHVKLHPNTAFETKVAQAASRRLYCRSQLCSQLGMQKAARNSKNLVHSGQRKTSFPKLPPHQFWAFPKFAKGWLLQNNSHEFIWQGK